MKQNSTKTVSSEVSAGQLGVLQVDSTAVAGIACGLKRILSVLTNQRPVFTWEWKWRWKGVVQVTRLCSPVATLNTFIRLPQNLNRVRL